jgi:hypothetical protein
VWDEYERLGKTDQVAKGAELSRVLLEKHQQQVIQAIKGISTAVRIDESNGPAATG